MTLGDICAAVYDERYTRENEPESICDHCVCTPEACGSDEAKCLSDFQDRIGDEQYEERRERE